MMTAPNLSKKQLNFARFSIVCFDVIKLPLKDILNIYIKPTELEKKIKACVPLRIGEYKLNPDQQRKCCLYSTNFPDYSKFDVPLLYKLIRNLCPTLEPTNKWGNKPTVNDVSIGDDVERIRILRNAYFAHAASAEISDDDFKNLWHDAKCVIYRCQQFTTSMGFKTDYNQMLTVLERQTLTFKEYTSRKEISRAIYIIGDTDILCGETACLEAEITFEQDEYLPVSWVKVEGLSRKQLDINNDKYLGSNSRQLIIHCMCKDDEAGYQAVILRKDVKIFSNEIYLRAVRGQGIFFRDVDPPCLELEYSKVLQEPKETLKDISSKKYEQITSETLKELFNSFKVDFPADVPGCKSFARTMLEDDINRLVTAIHSLSSGIVLTTQINAIKRDTPQVEACVFEVDVVYDGDGDGDEDQFCVFRKETSLNMLFEMEEDTRIRGILIRSKSLPVVSSKLFVYKNFKHVINEKGFFLQHEYEEIDDVAKMIAYRVILSFCSSVESLTNAFTADLRRSMTDYFDKPLTADKIKLICSDVLENTGYKPFGSTKSTRNWSSEVADFIQSKLSNEKLTGADAWSDIKSACCKTVEDLKFILNGLDKFQANELQIDLKKEIEEWHKREVIRNKSLLREYPSIVKYIAGHKEDGREVVKVFLSDDDEKAKEFVRKECRTVLKDIEFDFVNVENTEEVSEANENIDVLEEEIASFDNLDRLRLIQTIQECEEKIYARYSNIIAIEIGNVKRLDSPMQKGLGVVFYCLDNTLIPFGEKPLPKYIGEWPCEVLEDLFMLGRCPNTCSNHPEPGCSIGISSEKFYGSTGFLYESKSKDNTYKSGFFTASHVAIKDFHKLYLATQPLSNHRLRHNDHFIVHPSYLENNKSNNQVGQVVESFCGNFGDPPMGLDVAVVRDVSPRQKEMETLDIVKKSKLNYKKPIKVMKTGRKTETTYGYLIDPQKRELLSARLDLIPNSDQQYVFKMPYVVKDMDESKRFFLKGDSGSGVFMLGETGVPEKALGIAFGFLFKKPYTFVCNIEDILEKLDLKLVRYRQQPDAWDWSPKD